MFLLQCIAGATSLSNGCPVVSDTKPVTDAKDILRMMIAAANSAALDEQLFK